MPTDVRVLNKAGDKWLSIQGPKGDTGRPGKDAGITKADFDALDARLKKVEAALAALDGLPYDHDSSINIT